MTSQMERSWSDDGGEVPVKLDRGSVGQKRIVQ